MVNRNLWNAKNVNQIMKNQKQEPKVLACFSKSITNH